jgi:hypothetical protein
VKRSFRFLALAVLLPGMTATCARADLIITATSPTVTASATQDVTGTVDFTITSPSGDQLSSFGMDLQITLVTTSSNPYFIDGSSQPLPFSVKNYVFNGSSFDEDFGSPFWIGPRTVNTNNDTIANGDSADYFSSNFTDYPTIPDGAGKPASYLASVQFAIPQGTKSGAFQISLLDDFQTYFDDQNGNPLGYTFAGGLVTINGVETPGSIPVPEPVSTITSLTGAFFFTAYGWLRSRRSKRRAA